MEFRVEAQSEWFADPRRRRLSACAQDLLQYALEGSVRTEVPVEYIIDQIQGDPGHEPLHSPAAEPASHRPG